MIIIDGYNLLWAIQKLSDNFESVDDVRLCRFVGQYLKLTGRKGEMIFDGIGPPDKTGFYNIKNLEVTFVGFNTDADTVIENKIKASTAPKRLTIVSSDRRIRDAARARKATTLKSEEFWNNLCSRLKQKSKIQEHPAKQSGLDEGQTQQWLRYFGIEQ